VTSQPQITVLGVGGAGCNALNNMIDVRAVSLHLSVHVPADRSLQAQLTGVEFIACNTDTQSLQTSRCVRKIQLGPALTMGLGAGARPEVGTRACLSVCSVCSTVTIFHHFVSFSVSLSVV
jgi:cell division protein FtsZ